MDSNVIIFEWTLSILIPQWPVHVMTPKYDATDLNYDVIRVTVRDLLALCALNIRSRYAKNTSSDAELHGEHAGEGFMSLA